MAWDKFAAPFTEALKGHPDHLLAFGIALISAILVLAGINPWVAFGGPGIMYILSCLRQERAAAGKQRLAELELQKIELQLSGKAAARIKKAKERAMKRAETEKE